VLHNNAHPHVACIVQDILHSIHYMVLGHAPYSLDLLPCDFHVWPLPENTKRTNASYRMKISRWQQESGSSFSIACTLKRRSINYCINGMPVSASTGVICNSLHAFIQTTPYRFHLNKPHIIKPARELHTHENFKYWVNDFLYCECLGTKWGGKSLDFVQMK
jgi:hypothetical protein